VRASGELGVDLGRSAFVGDRPSDMAAANAAGIPHRVLIGGNAGDGNETCALTDLGAAVDHLLPRLVAAPAVPAPV
jgi:phosphoglycolate phosphatase-like HAD superfamily hydrolase